MQARQSKTYHQTSKKLREPLSQTVDAICAEHGRYKSEVTEYYLFDDKPTVVKTPCPACAERRKQQEEAKMKAQAAAERQDRVDRLVRNSGIPSRFLDRTFGSYAARQTGQKLALGVCRAYADGWEEKRREGASLVLTGAPGTGKTHLACAVAGAVIGEHLDTVIFTTVSSMLRSIKSTYRKDSEQTEQGMIDRLSSVALLILDEVGVQVGSEHEKLLMFEVLNERYQELKPTILISNLSVVELEDFLGQRVMDRYRECGAVLAFDWESHRGQR